MIEIIFLLRALTILVGAVLGFVTFIRSADLRRRMDHLKQNLHKLTANQSASLNEFQLAPESPVPQNDSSRILLGIPAIGNSSA
jgi:hypothetical protein